MHSGNLTQGVLENALEPTFFSAQAFSSCWNLLWKSALSFWMPGTTASG